MSPCACAGNFPFLAVQSGDVLDFACFAALDHGSDFSVDGFEVALVADHAHFARFIPCGDYFVGIIYGGNHGLFYAGVFSGFKRLDNLTCVQGMWGHNHDRINVVLLQQVLIVRKLLGL